MHSVKTPGHACAPFLGTVERVLVFLSYAIGGCVLGEDQRRLLLIQEARIALSSALAFHSKDGKLYNCATTYTWMKVWGLADAEKVWSKHQCARAW